MEDLNQFKDLTIYVNKMVVQFPELKDFIHDYLELCKLNIELGINPTEAIKIATRDINSMTGVSVHP